LRKTNSVAVPGRLVIGSVTNPPGHEIVRLFSQEQIANLTPVTVTSAGCSISTIKPKPSARSKASAR